MSPTLVAGGVRWSLGDGVRPETLFNADGLRLTDWLASGAASVVKDRPKRSVWRVMLPGLDFHIKYEKPATKSLVRGLLHASPARVEFERGCELAVRGVPTPEPLAFGESATGAGGNYLVTRTIPDAWPLDTFLGSILPTLQVSRHARLRQRVASALGRFLALLHDAGVEHRDLHPGNLLVRFDEKDRPTLWLIDLLAARLGPPLAKAASHDNLVIVNRWFILRSSRGDRLRFWEAYRQARPQVREWSADDADGRRYSRHIERATLRSNLAFWRIRDRRCLGTNRYFRRVHAAAASGHVVADLPREVLQPLLENPDAPFVQPGAKTLKDSPSSTVVELELTVPSGTLGVVYKRFAVTSWTDPWAALARRPAVLRSWIMGHALLTRLLVTPRPLLVLQRHRHGLPREGYLLTEKVPRAVDLAEYVLRLGGVAGNARTSLLRQAINRVGRSLAIMHERHVSHRDLKAPNVLLRVAADGLTIEELFFIDLVGVRCHRKLGRTRRLKNLARLHASFVRHPLISRTDKLRLLRAYLDRGLRGRSGWKRWWCQVEEATERKVQRNQKNGRPLR
jgi:tRNA A-37 threonylcarbamoyl transferase component Bud32